jgi:glycine betaine/choline ABC-type transport system substrate-binding protein
MEDTEIAAPIDEELMTSMNAAVDVDGEFPEDVATQYLQDQGFIE